MRGAADDNPERRPAEESQRRTEGSKPVSRKQKVNEHDSSELARSLNPDANGAGESTKVSNVERRGKPSQGLMELFCSKATDKNDGVVHPGQCGKEGEKLPGWRSPSLVGRRHFKRPP